MSQNPFCFEGKNLSISNQIWSGLLQDKGTFPLSTILRAMKDIVTNDGAVMIAMPNEKEIKERMDRLDEVCDVAQRTNETRLLLGLEPVDLHVLGLVPPVAK